MRCARPRAISRSSRRRLLPDSRRRPHLPDGLPGAGRGPPRVEGRRDHRRAGGRHPPRPRRWASSASSATGASGRSRRSRTPSGCRSSARSIPEAADFAAHDDARPFIGVDGHLRVLAAGPAGPAGARGRPRLRARADSARASSRTRCGRTVRRLLGRRRHDRLLLRGQRDAGAPGRAVPVSGTRCARSIHTCGTCPGRGWRIVTSGDSIVSDGCDPPPMFSGPIRCRAAVARWTRHADPAFCGAGR